MAQMTVQYVLDAGTTGTFGAANSTDTADVGNGHNTFLEVKNAGGSPINVTITDYYVGDNQDTQGAHVVAVPATTGDVLIPLRKSYDKGDGTGAQIAYSGVVTVTSRLMRLL